MRAPRGGGQVPAGGYNDVSSTQVDVEAPVIRSAFKRGIKRVLGMEGAQAPAPAPAPVWKTPVARAAAPAPDGVSQAAAEPDLVEVSAGPGPVEAVAPDAHSPDAEPADELPADVQAPEARPPVVDSDDTAGSAFTFEAVQEIMDEMVRPALQGDGGDITLLRIENNDIYVKLVGSCSTCPSSILTMKMGVEALLKEEFPAMNSLIQVD